LRHAIQKKKPIVVLKDIRFIFGSLDIPTEWKFAQRLLVGPRTLDYSAYYLNECSILLKAIRQDPSKQKRHFYTPDFGTLYCL
jgi:hypothetical protein